MRLKTAFTRYVTIDKLSAKKEATLLNDAVFETSSFLFKLQGSVFGQLEVLPLSNRDFFWLLDNQYYLIDNAELGRQQHEMGDARRLIKSLKTSMTTFGVTDLITIVHFLSTHVEKCN